jgi:hypothetical protein
MCGYSKTRIHLRGSLDAPWIRRSRAHMARVVFEILSASGAMRSAWWMDIRMSSLNVPGRSDMRRISSSSRPSGRYWYLLMMLSQLPCEYQGAKGLEDATRVRRRRAAWRLASRPASRTSKLSMRISRRAMLKEIWSFYDALLMLSRVTGLNLRSARTGAFGNPWAKLGGGPRFHPIRCSTIRA